MGNTSPQPTLQSTNPNSIANDKGKENAIEPPLQILRSIEKINKKAHFHYMHPIELGSDDVESQVLSEEEEAVRSEEEKGDESSPIRSMFSLEEIIEMEEKTLNYNKVGVNWNNFIKIKKKNYLEDYIFVKEIGRGAYGSVHKIKNKYGGLMRAAKIVKSSMITGDKGNSRQLVAQILCPLKLDHPNLVKLFQVFDYRGQYVLVLQLCEGGDLFHNIKQSRYYSQAKAAQAIKQVLSAVNYMHKQRVVHRDLKPENILVDQESHTLKIADFGTAAFLRPNQPLTEIVGTPYYMAPEVLNGHYDQKCDVWSCGVILYIMLSGSPPFNGHSQAQIIDKIKCKPLEFKNSIWNRRNKHAKHLISQMMKKNPQQRISAQQALNSEWLVEKLCEDDDDSDEKRETEGQVIRNLQGFHFKNKLKAVVYTYIASHLYQNKDKEKLLRVFREIDADGDGVIQKDELIRVFNSNSNSALTDQQVEKILELVDTNGSGQIDFTEFLVAASNEEKMLQEQRLQNAFNYLDSDHSGYITIEEVKAFLDGTEQTSDEIKKIFNQVDQNGDGEISKKQFVSLLLRKD